MPFYYRKDGRWKDVGSTDDPVQEFGEWWSDGRWLYRLLTHERYERLREWCDGKTDDVAVSLAKLVAAYEGLPSVTESQNTDQENRRTET